VSQDPAAGLLVGEAALDACITAVRSSSERVGRARQSTFPSAEQIGSWRALGAVLSGKHRMKCRMDVGSPFVHLFAHARMSRPLFAVGILAA
jgi:hypothetical protein